MKRHGILLLILTLVCAVGAAAEEPAATPEAPVVDAEAPISSEAIDPAQDVQLESHCSVQYTQCFDGQDISCTGHTSCESGTSWDGNGWVECDGQRTDCGGCSATCETSMDTCYGSNSCISGFGPSGWYIECDGNHIDCPPCPNPQEIFCTS